MSSDSTSTGVPLDEVEPLDEAYPALHGQDPELAAVLDRYEVITLRASLELGTVVGLLCRRPHLAGGATVLVHFTTSPDSPGVTGVEILPGSTIRADQSRMMLAQLVDQALAHESEDHPR